jgi:hypothetical protein
VQYLLLVFTIFEILEGPIHGGNERPTAIKGTMNHAKTSFSTEICAGAIMSVVQYLAPLRYVDLLATLFKCTEFCCHFV